VLHCPLFAMVFQIAETDKKHQYDMHMHIANDDRSIISCHYKLVLSGTLRSIYA
jgi:predicted DNA-binding protein with PD1-like motif